MTPTRVRARTALATVSAVGLALVGVACSGSGTDKGGGKPEAKPLSLTLESEDDFALSGAPEFAAAVKRLSGGSMRVELVSAGRDTEVDFERGVVKDVVAGSAQLGIVGVRVWDTMGVRSFQALVAPFLVDSLKLEEEVLTSSLAPEMLKGVGEAGVVGVALLPGPLRRPLGLSRPLVKPGDYDGTTIGIRLGNVASRTLRALGANAKGYVPGSRSGLDGVEIDPKTITYNGWDEQAGSLTTNVILWPKPYSILMNRKAFERLTAEQQQILFDAGRLALAPELRQTKQDAEAALSEACKHARLSFVTASPSELAALHQAVRPVYDELESDSQTRDMIAAIQRMRGSGPAALAPRCDRARRSANTRTSALEGRWQVTWTRHDLAEAGLSVAGLPRTWRATVIYAFVNGRFKGNHGELGTYAIEGNVLRLVFTRGRFVRLGRAYALKWSVYRDLLTLSLVPGSEPLKAHAIKPWRRVR